jgi:hypothetical protein
VKKFICVLLIMMSHLSWGQSDFAVTPKGDTIRGEFKLISFDMLDRVQVGTGKSKMMLKAHEIRMLRFNNEIYRPVLWEKSYRLMKVIKDGYLSLLAFRVQNQMAYDGRLLIKKDGSQIELPNLAFKKIMAAFVEECGTVSEQVKSGELGRKEIDQIIDAFNGCISERTLQKQKINAVDISVVEELERFQKVLTETADFSTKNDANDMLNDILSKVRVNDAVPKYLVDGLTANLQGQDSLKEQWLTTASKIKK